MGKKRTLSDNDKMRIISLVEDNELSQAEVARIYDIHRSRVHHILNDTYGCRSRLRLPDGGCCEEE